MATFGAQGSPSEWRSLPVHAEVRPIWSTTILTIIIIGIVCVWAVVCVCVCVRGCDARNSGSSCVIGRVYGGVCVCGWFGYVTSLHWV